MDGSLGVGSFVVTYLAHSTLLLVGVCLLARVLKPTRHALRELLWRLALVGGIVTSVATFVLPVPHWGRSIFLEGADSPRGSDALGHVLTVPVAAGSGEGILETTASGRGANAGGWLGAFWNATSFRNTRALGGVLAGLWFAGLGLAILRFGWHAWRLRGLERNSRLVTGGRTGRLVGHIARRMGVDREIRVYATRLADGPMASGLFHGRIFLPIAFVKRLSSEQLEALLAHEMAHLARRDPLWVCLSQLISNGFFFQPLNFYARRQLRAEAEYLADRRAVGALPDRVGLARCLVSIGEWLTSSQGRRMVPNAATVGMASFRSTLGKRVEYLLENKQTAKEVSLKVRILCTSVVLVLLAAFSVVAPRAMAVPLASAKDAAGVPEGLHGFRGMLAGTLVEKDVEKGTLTVKVAKVVKVWKANTAKEPESAVGKTLLVTGIAGKWLDTLLVVKSGESIEVEAFHNAGDHLDFVGEWLRKVPESETIEIVKVPEGMRGFSGMLLGKVVSREVEKGTLVLTIVKVLKLWKPNKSKKPETAVGKTLRVEGIAGKWLDVLLLLKAGDHVELEAFHKGGDNLSFLPEWLRKVDAPKPGISKVAAELRGFSGLVAGQVVDKDVEKGKLVLKVSELKKVWKNNKAEKPESIVEKTFLVEGISGKWLDVLLLVKPKDAVELEVFHRTGDNLSFPGEWFRKVE